MLGGPPARRNTVDLGTLDDNPVSEAFAVLGPRAFLYENGELANLNDLVDIEPDVLLSAQDINEAGQITGRVRDGVTGEVFAFVATPIEP